MKRDKQCPVCGGSGRHAELIAKAEDGSDIPAQCELCSGYGKIGDAVPPQHIRVPLDHPRAEEIARLLAE